MTEKIVPIGFSSPSVNGEKTIKFCCSEDGADLEVFDNANNNRVWMHLDKAMLESLVKYSTKALVLVNAQESTHPHKKNVEPTKQPDEPK